LVLFTLFFSPFVHPPSTIPAFMHLICSSNPLSTCYTFILK
jgi:hypothetical protein